MLLCHTINLLKERTTTVLRYGFYRTNTEMWYFSLYRNHFRESSGNNGVAGHVDLFIKKWLF